MLTLVKFYADWCRPCKDMQPTMNQLKEEYKNKIIFKDINIDTDPQLRMEHGISSIPAFILLQDDVEVNRMIGSRLLSELREFINEYHAR